MHNKFNDANEIQVSIKCLTTIFIFFWRLLKLGEGMYEAELFRLSLTVFRNLFFDVSLFSLAKCSHPTLPLLCWLQMGYWLA